MSKNAFKLDMSCSMLVAARACAANNKASKALEIVDFLTEDSKEFPPRLRHLYIHTKLVAATSANDVKLANTAYGEFNKEIAQISEPVLAELNIAVGYYLRSIGKEPSLAFTSALKFFSKIGHHQVQVQIEA